MQNSSNATTTKPQGKNGPSAENEVIDNLKSLNISSDKKDTDKAVSAAAENKKNLAPAPAPAPATHRNDNSNPQQGPPMTKTYAAMARGPVAEDQQLKQQQQQIVAPVAAVAPAPTSAPPSLPPQPPPAPIGPVSWANRKQTKIPPNKKDSRKLFIGGLPPDVTEHEFKTFFEQYGAIADSVVMIDRDTGRSRGFGFVTFEEEASAKAILEADPEAGLNGSSRVVMRGKVCEVKPAVPRDGNSRRDAQRFSRGPKPRHDKGHGAPVSPIAVGSPVYPGMPPMIPVATPVFGPASRGTVEDAHSFGNGGPMPPYHQGYSHDSHFHPHANYYPHPMPVYAQGVDSVTAPPATSPYASIQYPHEYPHVPYYGVAPNEGQAGMMSMPYAPMYFPPQGAPPSTDGSKE